jgi:hypothetical protein
MSYYIELFYESLLDYNEFIYISGLNYYIDTFAYFNA